MSHDCKDCPDEEMILDYVARELPFENEYVIEEHLFYCNKCTDMIRYLCDLDSEMLSLKANPAYGRQYRDCNCDIAMLPAAGSETNRGIFETKSVDGRYTLRIIPFLKGDRELLEVEVSDRNISGTLSIENDDRKIMEAPIIQGFARQEVSSGTDLRNILLKVM